MSVCMPVSTYVCMYVHICVCVCLCPREGCLPWGLRVHYKWLIHSRYQTTREKTKKKEATNEPTSQTPRSPSFLQSLSELLQVDPHPETVTKAHPSAVKQQTCRVSHYEVISCHTASTNMIAPGNRISSPNQATWNRRQQVQTRVGSCSQRWLATMSAMLFA
mgnify:CR=1 FL=1